MDFSDPVQRRTFFEVHRDLPREGPGNRQCTLRALDLLRRRGVQPAVVVDVACGPGLQTLDLATALPEARIVALDLHTPFLQALARRCVQARVDDRVTPVGADMNRLPVREGAADVIWCEGAAYVMGVEQALDAWRPLLRRGGACAFTEAVWLRDGDPPAPVSACWAGYPAMTDMGSCRDKILRAGYELVGDFVLPDEAWWDDYYGPMRERLDALERAEDPAPAAAAVFAECREEIEVRRRFADWYGYAFFIARKL